VLGATFSSGDLESARISLTEVEASEIGVLLHEVGKVSFRRNDGVGQSVRLAWGCGPLALAIRI